jgi:CheY-like chemotaxis protein
VSKTVLVVEDNPMNSKLIGDILEVMGLSFQCAETGAEGFRLAKELCPDLILMDIQLPDTSGLDVVAKVRAEPSLKDVAIVALTAFAMKGDADNFIAAGCDGYLSKPFNLQNLMTVIREYLKLEAA